MKKHLILLLIFILTLSTSLVFADGWNPANRHCSVDIGDFNDNGTAIINGKFTQAVENELVTVAIFAPQKGAEDLSEGRNQNDVLVFTDSAKSDADGRFKFEVTLSGGSGEYSAYFGPADENEVLERIPVYFSNKDENKLLLEELNQKVTTVRVEASGEYNADDIADIERFINTNVNALAFRISLYNESANSVKHSSVVKMLVKHLKHTPFNADNRTESTGIYRTIVVMRAFTENKIKNIDEYAKGLPILNGKDGVLSQWYVKASEKEKQEFVKRLSGLSFDTIDEFEKNAVEAAVLSRIHYADGEDEVKQILTSFKEYTEIDVSSLNQAVYDGLERNYYENYASLSSAIAQLKKSKPSEEGGGKSTGSSARVAIQKDYYSTKSNPEIIDEKEGFDDVSKIDWYYDAVYELFDRGIIAGKSKNTFAPNEGITREEIVKMLVVMENLTLSENDNAFLDVKPDDWFFGYVNTAAKNGIVNGTGDGIFGVGQNVTRQDTAVMLYNIALKNEQKIQKSIKELEFIDADSISDYANDAVRVLVDLKIIKGYEDGTFKPRSNVTRAEAAKLIREFIYVKEEGR